MNQLVHVTKSDGTLELFEEGKLVSSLRRAGAGAEAIDDVVEQIESKMNEGSTTADIYHRAFDLLRAKSYTTAVKYSVRRAIMDLGPDGFPFEKFVARIFRAWGYDTVTDQTLLGTCVDHEIDVIAWKGDTLSMVEAKYHNEFGMRTDVKVALYVKARFDDLSGNEFDYGGKKRKLSEKWLFTNTKFTDKAVKYGECTGLKLVGWNYPSGESLHDIIEMNSLQPVACLNTLTREQKKELIAIDILTASDILGRPKSLDEIGVGGESTENILAEAQTVIQQAK